MRTLVVYFDDPAKMGYPFDTDEYTHAYQIFSELCTRNDVQMVICRSKESYLGGVEFASGWKFEGKELVEVAGPITADVIFVKGSAVTIDVPVAVNQPGLAAICRDKLKTYELFKEYMAPTWPINTDNWKEVVAKVTTDKIVVKPVTGLEGRGIVIVPTAEFTYDLLDPKETYLAQEFVDCSAGIPGIVEGIHDLRMYIYNGKVGFGEFRQPKKGSYLANVAQGGSLTVVDVATLPQWATDFVPRIDKGFEQFFPRMYTIDLMYAQGRPYLVELNSRPGMPWDGWSYFEPMLQMIFDTLLSATDRSSMKG